MNTTNTTVTPPVTTSIFTWDPAIKNPYLYVGTNPAQPPPIPPRRLFQIADAYGSPTMGLDNDIAQLLANSTATGIQRAASNASIPGDSNINNQVTIPYVAATLPNNNFGLVLPSGLSYPQPLAILNSNSGVTSAYPDLTAPPASPLSANPPTKPLQNYAGGQFVTYTPAVPPPPATPTTPASYNWPTGAGVTQIDQTDHPYFRTEWLQKVTNLTTVRTHQYAVWITVGFFEVTQQGDVLLAKAAYASAYDTFGLELGALDGTNKRYRGFFLVDRTQATGFNPTQPGDFRACVAYRQLIE